MKEYLEINKKAYDQNFEAAKKPLETLKEDYKKIFTELEKFILKNNKVLELGPGNGYISKILSKKYQVTAIELSKKRARLIRKLAPKVKVINGEFLSHKFKNEKFDVIIGLMFIHLFPRKEIKKLINKIKTLLNEEGLICISTSVHKKADEGYKKHPLYQIIRFRKEFTKVEIEDLLKSNKFKIIKKLKIGDPVTSQKIVCYICKILKNKK